jgi:hypothetical protein
MVGPLKPIREGDYSAGLQQLGRETKNFSPS